MDINIIDKSFILRIMDLNKPLSPIKSNSNSLIKPTQLIIVIQYNSEQYWLKCLTDEMCSLYSLQEHRPSCSE